MKQSSVNLRSVGFAVAMATAGIANAAVHDVGVIAPGTTFADYIAVPRLGAFESRYTFALPTAGVTDVTRTISYKIDDTFSQAVSRFAWLTTEPNPDQQGYAMLLAGLGILGTVISRRSNGF